VVPDTGPFPGRGFLQALWRYDPHGDLCLSENGSALVPLTVDETGLRWVGHPDLVDYRSPLGAGADDIIADVLTASPAGLHFRFDSLPDGAAEVVHHGLEKAGVTARRERHTVTARLLLPQSYEEYLERIGKKERHEVRRKRRRFREVHGPPALITTRGAGEGFEQFAEMHRNSDGSKGTFMTAAMEDFFASLADQQGWRVDLLCGEDGQPVAATFSWADADGMYLYNSAYDRRSEGSPGIVLLSMLIEQAILLGCLTFDFLKGDEPYKFRLGAEPRPLFRFEGST
jgi:CelD/BcsL family acetyltransferase involved in cellulose biosynthesis